MQLGGVHDVLPRLAQLVYILQPHLNATDVGLVNDLLAGDFGHHGVAHRVGSCHRLCQGGRERVGQQVDA
ncbi:hypothetical protein D3C71_2093000 [compost metagenome]